MTEPTDTVVLLRELASDKALDIGRAWNAMEHAANEIEALRTLERPIRSAAESVAFDPSAFLKLMRETSDLRRRQSKNVTMRTNRDYCEGEADALQTYADILEKMIAAPRPDPPEVDEAVRRDAERYRWLRENAFVTLPASVQIVTASGSAIRTRNPSGAGEIDQGIDALTAALKPAAGSV